MALMDPTRDAACRSRRSCTIGFRISGGASRSWYTTLTAILARWWRRWRWLTFF